MWRMSFFIIDLEEDDHCLGEENVQESDCDIYVSYKG